MGVGVRVLTIVVLAAATFVAVDATADLFQTGRKVLGLATGAITLGFAAITVFYWRWSKEAESRHRD